MFRVLVQKTGSIHPENSNVWWTPFFHRCCSHRTRLPRVKRFFFFILGVLVLLARYLKFTKAPCQSFLAAYGCFLAHPTPSHTPSGACLNFAGHSCLWGAVAVRKWRANVQLAGVPCFNLCTPNFGNFDGCSTSKLRRRLLLRIWPMPIWKKS